MMAKFVLILYVPGIPALSMSDIDFDFGGVWPKEIIKSNRDCLYVLVRNVTLLLLLLLYYCVIFRIIIIIISSQLEPPSPATLTS